MSEAKRATRARAASGRARCGGTARAQRVDMKHTALLGAAIVALIAAGRPMYGWLFTAIG
jgi:hypothetical protein